MLKSNFNWILENVYGLHILLILSPREIYRYVHLTVIETISYTTYVIHAKQKYAVISQYINSWHIKRVCLQIKRILIFLSAVFLLCQTPTLFLPRLEVPGIFNNSLEYLTLSSALHYKTRLCANILQQQ